jgi:hypothetical protein
MVSVPPRPDDLGMNTPDLNHDGPLLICYDGSEDAKHASSERADCLPPSPRW